jgi:GTPase SAR1 family protein
MTEKPKTTSVKVNEAIFKVILIGDSGTGKTSLITRYIRD